MINNIYGDHYDYKGREYTENSLKMWKCRKRHIGCLFTGVLDIVNSVIWFDVVDVKLNKIKNPVIQSLSTLLKLSSHIQRVVAVLERPDIKHSHYCNKFSWAVLVQEILRGFSDSIGICNFDSTSILILFLLTQIHYECVL